ncbi:uroporphyrinogen-III synthase [Desulfurispira natronophila]|uniref:Uroporphyrinogen-III synthase n=1 Tax=Desulfurispira natronophila TaxID=682562 RepID=A0A7W7Y6J7_9BACT|nr:uroporphyrinogen-III synthase [Desulfurispira natronophila]MBB5022662.1 uroporphyrinogen III methyltransferase/synthase [Desulfurispira natronophila]
MSLCHVTLNLDPEESELPPEAWGRSIGFDSYSTYIQAITRYADIQHLDYQPQGECLVHSPGLILGSSDGPVTINTRPVSQSWPFTCRLLREGFRVIVAPASHTQSTLSLEEEEDMLPSLERCSHVLLTSREGVKYFAAFLRRHQQDPGRISVAVIGKGTAQASLEEGFFVDYVARTSEALSFAKELVSFFDPDDTRFLLARGVQGRNILPRVLEQNGFACDEVALYRSVGMMHPPAFLHEVLDINPDYMVFTSSFAAEFLLQSLRSQQLYLSVPIVTIGPPTSQTVEACGYTVFAQADHYDVEGLITILRELRRV